MLLDEMCRSLVISRAFVFGELLAFTLLGEM